MREYCHVSPNHSRTDDGDGNLILLPQEVARVEQERANREQQEKEQTQTELHELRDRLIAMGLNPDNLPNNS